MYFLLTILFANVDISGERAFCNSGPFSFIVRNLSVTLNLNGEISVYIDANESFRVYVCVRGIEDPYRQLFYLFLYLM